MDYEKMSAGQFRDAVSAKREQIYAKTYNVGSMRAEKIMLQEYENLCVEGAGGDPIAEDLLAEWFRNGNQIVPENIDVSMKWLILAGANGNKYSLDRLKLHFSFAFDTIIAVADFGEIANKFDIDQYNYHYVLGKLICDAVVDDMKINPLELARQKPTKLPYSAVVLRAFDRSINRAVDTVIAYLRRK